MITILTQIKDTQFIAQAINKVDRLAELVLIAAEVPQNEYGQRIIEIKENQIIPLEDWFGIEPPLLLPSVAFSDDALLALIFYKLGNHDQALFFAEGHQELSGYILVGTKLRLGHRLTAQDIRFIDPNSHNAIVINQYRNDHSTPADVEARYDAYLTLNRTHSHSAFTAYIYISFLIERGQPAKAHRVATEFIDNLDSDYRAVLFKSQLALAQFHKTNNPLEEENTNRCLEWVMAACQVLEAKSLEIPKALLLLEAAEIANTLEDFPKAKGFAQQALQLFKEEDLHDLMAEAALKKAQILYRWSKNGSPQYYKAAINAFQDVLKVFKKDIYPEGFAQVHHQLGMIYAEMPASPEERAMWAAFAASAFKESLSFFTKESYPYEYAMVCHNYATALMEFPPAKLHNNYEKSYQMFLEALKVRTPDAYPTERAITLTNLLELSWLMHNENIQGEEKRWQQMVTWANEILELTQDEKLILLATEQLEKLDQLKTIIS